jgi:DNA-binding winged helix-turn-helix (wHTH) protein/Tol biopolymer transport system component
VGAEGNVVEREPRAGGRLRFGAFEMDLRSGELHKSGVAIHLQPQPFRVLALLTSRPGEVVTRDEIRAELWPAGASVDFEQSLNFCIRQVRSALNDSALAPRFVETLPRRGYRWVGGPVEVVPDGGEGAQGSGIQPTRAEGEARGARRTAGPSAGWLPRGGWRWGVAALAVPVLVVLALAGRSVLRRPERLSMQRAQRVTFRRGFLTGARFAPEGQVVYVASWEGHPRALYLSGADPTNTRSLDLPASRLAGVSASGEVALIRDGVLARAPLAGGPPKEVAVHVQAADWTANASTFAVIRVLENGYRLEYPIGHPLGRVLRARDLRVSPDGRYLAFSQHPTWGDDRGFVAVVDGEGRRLATSETFGSLEGLAWSPTGDEVWFTAARVGAKSSLRALTLDGRERSLLSSMGRLVLYDVAADGRLLISRSTHGAEILFRRAAEPAYRDLSWLDVSAVAALSADGSSILFYEGGDGGGPDYTTYLRRTDGSRPVRLGAGRALDLSPDGQWALVVAITRPDHLSLMPTGPGESREIRVPGPSAAYDAAGWLPDGRTLFVSVRNGENGRSTWLIGMDGSHPRRLPLPEGRSLTRSTFSPDGRLFVAACPAPDERPCLYEVAGGTPQPVPGAEAKWTAIGWDGQGRIFFRDRPAVGAPVRLFRLDPTAGTPEVVRQLGPPDTAGLVSVYNVFLTPDASAWAYTVIRRQSDLYVTTGVE